MRRMLCTCALALGLVGNGVAAPVAGHGDQDFLAARAAFERGERTRLDALALKLADHILRPYLEFWQLKHRLETVSDAQIGAFLARWPKRPLLNIIKY